MNAAIAISDDGGRQRAAGKRVRERTCLVSRSVRPETELIRFALGPDGTIVPDLKARLPGRGVWVTADRHSVGEAVRRRLFARGLRTDVVVPADLPQQVAELLSAAALGRLGLARKAGQLAAGFTQVAAAIEKGNTILVLVASDAANDGRRKIDSLIGRRFGPEKRPKMVDCWSSAELGLAIGRTNVIHAAVLEGAAGQGFKRAAMRFLRYEEPAVEDADEPQDSDV